MKRKIFYAHITVPYKKLEVTKRPGVGEESVSPARSHCRVNDINWSV